MRFRTLLAIGAGVALVATVIGFVIAAFTPDGDNSTAPALIISAVSVVAIIAALGFAVGWFGRGHDEVMMIAIGAGLAGAVVILVISLFADDWRIAAVVIAPIVAVVGGMIGQGTWRIADSICDFRELPTMGRLTEPAYPEEFPGTKLWTTEAGPALRDTMDALAERIAAGRSVDARAVGIMLGFPRDRPMVAVLAGGTFAVQPIDLAGAPTAEPVVLAAHDVAEASIVSEAHDGSERRSINTYDDIIDVRSTDGTHLRLRLPYGTRGAGTSTGGPEALRAWLRTSAATYR